MRAATGGAQGLAVQVITIYGPIRHFGSAHVRPSRFADPERVVGITTVFSADGNYILSNMSREADYERHPEELLCALRGCIDDVKKRNAWQPEDSIRLIFHVFKPLRETEAEAVKRLVSGLLSEFRISTSFRTSRSGSARRTPASQCTGWSRAPSPTSAGNLPR